MIDFTKKMSWLGDKLGDAAGDVGDVHWTDVLRAVGLQKRRSALSYVIPAVGFLIAGGAIGAGIGLLLAPASGRRTRQNVEDRISTLKERFKNDVVAAAPSTNHATSSMS